MGWFDDISNTVTRWASSTVHSIGGFVTSTYDSISSAIGSAARTIADTAKTVGQGIYNFVGDAATGVASITKQVYGDIKDLVNRPFDVLQSPLSLFAISAGVIGGAYLFTRL